MSRPFIGRFVDVAGLGFRCGSLEGTTNSAGEFQYEENGQVSFYVGDLHLGTAQGKSIVNILDCVEKTEDVLENPKLLNRARLLFSLTSGIGFEKGIVINDKVRKVITKYINRLNLDSPKVSDLDSVLLNIGLELQIFIKPISHVRNHLRRAAAGFKVLRDVRIPVRDRAYIVADVYLPLDDSKKYPVLLSSTIYGKRVVYSGPNLDDPDDIEAFEEAEDKFFSTPPEVSLDIPNTGPWFGNWAKQRKFETVGTFNTFTYVPRGYAMVKIDPRGVSQTPGARGNPAQDTADICDAVEWTAVQPWCTGNVALAGNSYGANAQWSVALLKPKGLKAFIPFAGDIDRYRELMYIGGVPVFNYLQQWSGGVRAASPKWKEAGDMMKFFSANPFYNEIWEKRIPDLKSIDLPCFMAACQLLICHNRGSYEAWRELGSKEKHLEIVDSDYFDWPNHQVADKIIQFADRHLKGIKERRGYADTNMVEPVGMQMRVGGGLWYWRTEEDWPVPNTQYIKHYLLPNGTINTNLSKDNAASFSYSADPKPKGAAGVTFVSGAFSHDIELAGHFTATIHVSSSNHDADVVVQIWAIDEKDNIVRFCISPSPEPLAFGILRASHRKTDAAKSLPYRPWHTHTQEDHAPLAPGEVAKLEVEIFPATARIKRGWKLRVDITPSEEQPSIPDFHPPDLRLWEKDIHDGAANTVHVGGDYVSFVTLPVVPKREMGEFGVVPPYRDRSLSSKV